ncbi:HAMP domain-containing sensor histidine kinase [Salinimicrobium sp. MT39]|uniref:histidine kinase n=1 Tax=Salinimicrobium profundisediminis TaxID=2994553 RepID=A0A9X3I1T1_9FLAO|nr:HAMP domain-containing sensor histidine kinase [Salinimicrobium profundisediminis]MCX2838252.1 HAMP domain-containing sensor histidine kinase [Salinimicrobium profundisediminis]
MKKSYQRIPYLLIIVIAVTITIQLYWSYTEYQKNTVAFKNEIQNALDVAIDNYFVDFAKENSVSLKVERESGKNPDNFTITGGNKKIIDKFRPDTTDSKNVSKSSDSLKMLNNIKDIYISINEDSINFKKLKSLLNAELKRRDYNIPYKLNHYKKDSLFATSLSKSFSSGEFSVTGKSTYLKNRESLELQFPNAIQIIVKKSLLSILISLLLMTSILFALFYLQWVIKQQKQLSEIKNDLISNITHEFKTPIATIGAAIESIRFFNTNHDVEKTNRYLDYSDQQLKKLEKMVDQLMDTALLDSENWTLDKHSVDIPKWAADIVENYRMNSNGKEIILKISEDLKSNSNIEPFHLGNCLGALLDNAIKYGGNRIEVGIENKKELIIQVSDNATILKKEQAANIFDKFYRVPQGNLHNVKGYGIGLYYVRKIAEKHNGAAEIVLKNNKTSFIISIPNE